MESQDNNKMNSQFYHTKKLLMLKKMDYTILKSNLMKPSSKMKKKILKKKLKSPKMMVSELILPLKDLENSNQLSPKLEQPLPEMLLKLPMVLVVFS
jgi:hypothetical protein